MNDLTMLLVGAFVTLLFFSGIALSVSEFRKMDRRPEAYGPEADMPIPTSATDRRMDAEESHRATRPAQL